MKWYDRVALYVLGGLIVWLVAALFFLGNSVADLDDRPQQVDIQTPDTPPTTPPISDLDGTRICVDDGTDTNWAARLGVADEPRCA